MTFSQEAAGDSFQTAVRAATHRALEARERLLAECPDWPLWRRQVRSLKGEMVRRWPEYLARLKSQVEAWGGVVYLARNAAEARGYILETAKKHGARRLIQSKSMTAHEIRLEPFLRGQGLQLTETDLGEYIIQLAGQPPAHLTAPALHLNRRQIARILSDHLGRDAPEEPGPLTRFVAAALRPCYEEADMGITGVNFAAAREGVLVCLENEGNLRLTACRPPVHLALMGWDKLVPEMETLGPPLRLLPASATGQRLTSLVHFFQGLKNRAEGRQAFYLVILDNGRSRLAAHPELKEALYCLRCGACLNICPVFQVGAAHLYGRVYPGAIGILLAPYLPPPGDLAALCTQCGSCREVCPAGLELPEKIRFLRQKAPSFRRFRSRAGAAAGLMAHPGLYRGLEFPFRHLFRWPPLARLEGLGALPPAPESFWKGLKRRTQGEFGIGEGLRNTTGPPAQMGQGVSGVGGGDRLPEPGGLPPGGRPGEARFAEAGATVVRLTGPQSLARYLAETARGEIWLAHHPSLIPVARELAGLGTATHLAQDDWAPEADTVVTPGLGAIPETGTVAVGGGHGPSEWLPFRARRHVVLVSNPKATYTLEQALGLTAGFGRGQVSWLTGPTRTADIEKLLVLGAQGPEELTVVVYAEETGGE